MNEEENALWRGFEARLERLEHKVQELLDIVHGNRYKKIVGLESDVDRMDSDIRKLNAVMFMDSTGKHGVAHDVEVLMGRQAGVDRRSEFRWKYWMPTLLALLALTVTVLTNLEKIRSNFPKYHPGPLELKIDQAKHPKGKKIVRYRTVPVPSEDTEESPPK